MVEAALLSIIAGATAGLVSRIAAIKAAKLTVEKERKKRLDSNERIKAEASESMEKMQRFIDGLISQISEERIINSEYTNDISFLSQKLKVEEELSEQLYDALLVQEPKIKRQFDAFNKAKAFYAKVHKD